MFGSFQAFIATGMQAICGEVGGAGLAKPTVGYRLFGAP
jgi:hypothetical protein